MSRFNRMICAGLVIVAAQTAVPSTAAAQAANPGAKPPLEPATVQIDVALTRWQGEKKTSSLPFVLIVHATPRGGGSNSTSLRMGVDVPVGTSTSSSTQTTGAQGSSPRAVETSKAETVFRNVGTDIDGQVTRTDESTFGVYVNVRDSSIFSSDPTKPATSITDPTAFRTFNASNTLPMKDGQTRLFGLATDKITGETMRIEVKLTVLK